MNISAIPDPRKRWQYIKAELQVRGVYLMDIARELSIGSAAVSHAATQPNERVERTIARHLGRAPNEIFPDRYDHAGRRTVLTRRLKGSRAGPQAHVHSAGAAQS